jgi:hypothetical protein
MDPTGAVTPEAKKLNPEYHGRSQEDDALDERGGRMEVYLDLPDGRLWDEQHAAHVRDINETWAPFTVLRKQLIEAGWRAIGPQMLLSKAEQDTFWKYRHDLGGDNGDDARTAARQNGSGITPYPRPH